MALAPSIRTTPPLEHDAKRARTIARVSQVIDYVFFLVYALLGLRFLLGLLGARPGAGFVRFVRALTAPLYAPFEGIVPTARLDGAHLLVWPLVVAVVSYALLHVAIRRLLRMIAYRRAMP